MTGHVITLRDVLNFIVRLVDVLWIAATFVVMGFIVWAGVRMVTSKGDATKFGEAKAGLIKAIIGGVVIFGVGIIVRTLAAIGSNPTGWFLR